MEDQSLAAKSGVWRGVDYKEAASGNFGGDETFWIDQIKDSFTHLPALQVQDPSTGEQTASFLQPQREEQFIP